jgi:hypothetical protein
MAQRIFILPAVVATVLLAVTGCTSAGAVTATPAPTSASPATAPPTPTPSVVAVAPGERPPLLFDGACESVLSSDDVESVLGAPGALDESGGGDLPHVVASAGGIECAWHGGDQTLVVAAFPAHSLDEVDLQTVDIYRTTVECGWYCTVVQQQDDLVIVTTYDRLVQGDVGPATHADSVDAAARVTPLVAANAESAGSQAWARDRSAWLSPPDCGILAERVGASLGIALTGLPWDIYVDAPRTGILIGDAAARLWACKLTDDSGRYIESWAYSGAAWAMPTGPAARGLPGAWTGVVSPDQSRTDGTTGDAYALTDGVNQVRVSPVPADIGASPELIAAAIASALSS